MASEIAKAAIARITKNQAISAKILIAMMDGTPVDQAIDRVLGAGTWKKLTGELYDELRKKDRASRPGAKDMMAKFKIGDRVAYKPYVEKTAGELVEIRKPTSLEGVEMQYGIKQAGGAIMWVSEGMVVKASRPGTPARFAVEDRFYFGKGRKERFASKEQALAFIKQYKRNEDSNAHSENVVLLAKFMGNSRAAKLASLVQQINEVAGHMPHGVGQFQYNELHAPLWKQFIAQYGDLYASVK